LPRSGSASIRRAAAGSKQTMRSIRASRPIKEPPEASRGASCVLRIRMVA
jgi:hypothetical protein